MRYKTLVAAILLALITPSRAEGLPDLGDTSESALPARQERLLGQQVMREIRADKSYVDDPELVAYVRGIGLRLLQAGAPTNQDFEFFLIDDASLNAFALPGGFVGIHTGAFLAAQNESELAGILSHEIAHVTQRHYARFLAGQKSTMLTSLAALAVAVLASRSNSQLSSAAIATAQATAIQSQLDFTREHEQEADRVGLQTMSEAGIDPRGMASFFQRLQRSTRTMEGNAPSYLRTHPLTVERIADMQNRLEKLPVKEVPDSLDFLLVKAKIRAMTGSRQEALKYFDAGPATANGRIARAYGMAVALRRTRELVAAEKEINQLRARGPQHPMIESLAAGIKRDQGQYAAALELYRAGLRLFPQYRSLVYGELEILIDQKNYNDALKAVNERLKAGQDEEKLYDLQSKIYAGLGKRLLQHQAQAEVYYRRGNLPAAADQLEIALRSGDSDFYQVSSVEARLREIRAEMGPSKASAKEKP